MHSDNSTKIHSQLAPRSVVERLGELVYEKRREAYRVRTRGPIIVKKKVKPATPFPIEFIFCTIIIFSLLTFIAYSLSIVNEVSYEIDNLESQIAAGKEENRRLTLQLDKKLNLNDIEREAIRLGMVKSSEVGIHYVSIAGGDKIVITEENNTTTSLGTALDGLKSAVGKIYK